MAWSVVTLLQAITRGGAVIRFKLRSGGYHSAKSVAYGTDIGEGIPHIFTNVDVHDHDPEFAPDFVEFAEIVEISTEPLGLFSVQLDELTRLLSRKSGSMVAIDTAQDSPPSGHR